MPVTKDSLWTPSELNDWDKSLPTGLSAENAVTTAFSRYLGLDLLPNNHEDPKNPDLTVNLQIDVKYLTSPYPKCAQTPAGLNYEEHLTLDVSNINEYPDNTLLLLVVDYTKKGVPVKGLFIITSGRVKEIMRAQPRRVYSRSERTKNDKVLKVGISIMECGRLNFPGLNEAGSLELIQTLMGR